MKKITAILLGTLIASSAVLAQTNQVLSRNAVGYIKRTVNANSQDFVAVPFRNLNGSANTVSNVFPTASNLTQVSFWNPGLQQYQTFLRSKGTWGTAGTNVITRGQGLFVQSPAGVTQEFFLMGEVPDRFGAETTTVQAIEGINALAVAYPVAQSWTSTPISASMPNLAQISVWSKTLTNYITIVKSKGSWGASGNALVLQPGDGFFLTVPVGGATVWNQTKPYTWP